MSSTILKTVLVLAICAGNPLIAQDFHGDPYEPIGDLTVTPTVVQPGVHPEMFWGIEYPKSIPDLTVIVPPGKLVTTNDKPVKLTMRVAGVSFSDGDTDLPVALWVRTSSTGSWTLLFYGRENDVIANEVVYKETISSGTHVDFAARGQSASGSWTTTQWTLADTPNIAAVIDGDSLPSESPAFVSGGMEDFMTQFVDANDEVEAGPRDIVHLFEVGSTEPGVTAFDMQDIVVVTTLERDNNGHGNNEDSVDMSNPGQAPFDDSDPFIDDEKKHIKRAPKDSV